MSPPVPFAPEARRTVIWIGPPGPKPVLTASCGEQGLELRQLEPNEVEGLAPHARALLMPVARADAEFMRRARTAARQCLTHGLHMVLVIATDAVSPDLPAEEEIFEYSKASRRLQAEGFPVRGLNHHWTAVAIRLAGLPMEPGENRGLTLTGADLRDEEKTRLLRRAFYDYRELHLEALDGGKSGARTVRVTEGNVPDPNRPVVAKVSSPEKIDRERSGYLTIEKKVPPRLYAPLVKERCLSASQHALAVYRFLELCDPLPARLSDAGVAFVDHLFSNTLGELHQPQGARTAPIQEIFGDNGCKLLRWTDDLDAAAAEARQRDDLLPGPTELRALIEELPRHDYESGTVHGDLHIGNLFVPSGSTEAVIIDYGSVEPGRPLLIDPACFEVSLAFPPNYLVPQKPAPRLPFRALLLSAYRYPLRAGVTKELHDVVGRSCSLMVRRIREIARKVDDNPTGYPIAVAAYLLRYCSYGDNASVADRSVAYELAAHLFSDAGIAMHKRRAQRIGGS